MQHLNSFPKFAKLFITVVGSLAAGWIGSLATTPNIPTWYASLDKPPLNPPNEIFGPVWGVLYLLMGIAMYLVWVSRAKGDKRWAVIAFILQLILNTLWSVIFFGLQQPYGGVAVILVLLASIIWTAVEFKKFSKLAALLLVPYILWVCFATYLNAGVAVLN